MNGRNCECTDSAHTHEETCGAQGYSWSIEHNNAVYCKKCYDDFVARKNIAKDIFSTLLQIAPSDATKARDALIKVLSPGGSK